MTPFSHIQKGVAAYLDKELMPLLNDSTWKRVAAGTVISLAIARADQYIPILQENPFIKALGIMDEAGNIDLDTLVPEIKKNVPSEGMKVDIPMLGTMTLHSSDVDKLHNYIKQAGGTA